MGGTEEMEKKEKRETVFVHLANQVCPEHQESRELQERRGTRVSMECRDLLGFLVPVDQLARKVCVETPAYKGLKENKESRVHHQEESPTLAGVGQPAPLAREQSWYMQAELGELTGSTVEEQPTISVCQMTLTICNIRVEYKATVI